MRLNSPLKHFDNLSLTIVAGLLEWIFAEGRIILKTTDSELVITQLWVLCHHLLFTPL